MKKILILGLLLGVWLSQVEAGCKRSDIANLKHKGFSVAEISRICGISYKRKQAKTKKHHRRSSGGGRLMNVTEDECNRLAGSGDKTGDCRIGANCGCMGRYERAKKICRRAGGRVPTLNDLKKVASECGIKLSEFGCKIPLNREQKSCVSHKGFSTYGYYWTRNKHSSPNMRLTVGFGSCIILGGTTYSDRLNLRCIK